MILLIMLVCSCSTLIFLFRIGIELIIRTYLLVGQILMGNLETDIIVQLGKISSDKDKFQTGRLKLSLKII